MLEMFVVRETVFFLTGVMIGIGILARLVTGISQKRLVRAASNMSKSNHPLMRLVRAKFEHGCMVSDKVRNVEAFVEKYMYEYRVLGVRLHTWRQWTKGSGWICLLLGMIGTALAYVAGERGQGIYCYGILGGAGAIVLLLFRMMADDSYQIDAAKNYMVDFLENTYAHRYAKANQKEIQVTVQRAEEEPDRKEEEVLEKKTSKSIIPKKVAAETIVPVNAVPTSAASGKEEHFTEDHSSEKLEPTKEARIREILEEFLA